MSVRPEHQLSRVEADVLVLGGGMAGHRAALSARRAGASVVHAFRAHGASSFMICANVPLGHADHRDSAVAYAADIMHCGYGLSEPSLVEIMSRNAVASFRDLVDLGVPFVREEQGYAQRLLAGNSYPRGVYTSAGNMGSVIIECLSREARNRGVNVLSGVHALHLFSRGGAVHGALLADVRSNALIAVDAKCVVLAMGGIGRLYDSSTYPVDVSADAYVLALEAGATLIDMEFIQFEPVVTVEPEGARGMEMPTAMLGDGAQLVNAHGERLCSAIIRNTANG